MSLRARCGAANHADGLQQLRLGDVLPHRGRPGRHHGPQVAAVAGRASEHVDGAYAVAVHLEGLELWMRRSGVTLEFEQPEGRHAPTPIGINFKPPTVERLDLPGGAELETGGTWHLRGDHVTNTELGQGPLPDASSAFSRPFDDELLNFAQACKTYLLWQVIGLSP
jgi:hypothetical protein